MTDQTDLFAQQKKPEDSKEQILADQQKLAEEYELLEKKLFSLYQYEQDQNPERAELLQKAFQSSKERLTLQKLNQTVQQLQQAKLRNAAKSQEAVTAELKALLDLLQSEDRSERVRDQIQRFKEYTKEVNRVLRIQQGIRGRNERGRQDPAMADEQSKNAKRTGDLKRKIEAEESNTQAPKDDPRDRTQPNQSQPSQQGQQGQPGQEGQQGQQGQQGQPGQQGPQGQEGQQQSKSDSPQNNPPSPAQSVQQKLDQAEKKMREAQQKMQALKGEESLQEMRQAEQKLQEAKQELERILRQLREEEIKRTLASLESRFRRMLEIQIKIYDDTVAVDRSRQTDRAGDLAIQCGKLSVRQKGLVTEVARALLLLEDDGTSIAIAESVRQLGLDMQQISDRLSASSTGEITQEIQQSVIETLGFLVEVLEQAKKDADQKSNPNQPSKPNRPGEQALVNQIAELKLIRGLQQQILRRHSRYASLLPNPDDKVGQTNDPVIRSALDKLSLRQQTLQQITRDIVIGKKQ